MQELPEVMDSSIDVRFSSSLREALEEEECVGRRYVNE